MHIPGWKIHCLIGMSGDLPTRAAGACRVCRDPAELPASLYQLGLRAA